MPFPKELASDLAEFKLLKTTDERTQWIEANRERLLAFNINPDQLIENWVDDWIDKGKDAPLPWRGRRL